MRYLTVRESARMLRAAGLSMSERQLLHWARPEQGRDVWVVGRQVYIYEAEVRSLIQEQQAPPA